MHTLEQLRRGELTGARRLDLACGLQALPDELLALADSLEILNLSGNRLDELPDWLGRFGRLRILFCSDNAFTRVPEVLGDCPALEMVGFKANRIAELPAAALPTALRWLILTDNALPALPAEIGACTSLQKLMLAGNRLSALPESLAQCERLELLRIAANRLEALPGWLFERPALAWLAYAGNPLATAAFRTQGTDRPPIAREQIRLGPLLGEGASGLIHRAHWQPPGEPGRDVAVKLFKGAVTSDGLPDSEMAACLAAGAHPNLLPVVGPLSAGPGEPPGLLMELLGEGYHPLAGPPSFASCTRDCYAEGQRFSLEQVRTMACGLASAVAQLHRRGILHGDLYAHNLLVDAHGHCLLSDFGAASFFAPDSSAGQALQRIEALAFGRLLGELLARCADHGPDRSHLEAIREDCEQPAVHARPDFDEMSARLLQH